MQNSILIDRTGYEFLLGCIKRSDGVELPMFIYVFIL